jgi:hypothetical protein
MGMPAALCMTELFQIQGQTGVSAWTLARSEVLLILAVERPSKEGVFILSVPSRQTLVVCLLSTLQARYM